MFILVVAGYALVLIICIRSKRSTITSKFTLFNKWEKLAVLMAKPLVPQYKWNIPMLLGKCKTGGFINLHFISSNAVCCSFSNMNCLPFLVKSYICFNNFCSSGQNILRKFTIPTKLLHPLTVVDGCNFCMASNLLLNDLMQTLLSFMNIVLPLYCNCVLNNWHFFGEILSPFFSKAFNTSFYFAMYNFFDGVNSNRSSIIASQYFLLCKNSNIAFI